MWKPQDPNIVAGLIFDLNTEKQNYWLQIFQAGNRFHSGIYGISAYGRFEHMGMELCSSLEEAKKHAEMEWESFKQNSRLYRNAKDRGAK